jgi:hypothetical protein
MKTIPAEQNFVKRRKDDHSNGQMVYTRRGCSKQHYWVKLRDVDVFKYEPTDADGYRDVDITVLQGHAGPHEALSRCRASPVLWGTE